MSDFVSIVLGLDKEENNSFEEINGKLIGYKVMQYDPKLKALTSGANKNLKLKLSKGAKHQMPGDGIFLSNDPKYVVDYYSYKEDEDDPDEVVIQYAFYLSDVIRNRSQMSDKNPEIGVREALVKGFISIDEWNKGKRFK